MHKQILNAVEQAWDEYAKVHIIFMVADVNGNYFENVHFPIGQETNGIGKSKWMTINVSVNACKMFNYDEESGDFTYDVGVNGKGFFGNIPANLVAAVVDANSGKVYWDVNDAIKPNTNYSQGDYKMVDSFPILGTQPKTESPKVFTPPKIVVSNDHIVPKSNGKFKPVLVK